eukprot:CAMPEP_0176107596 /NCGR_PEP_ID=MMETSP0120_2-20121206/54002_1 /TAXON_ID=160619 /ORGANISM="Kryptoperidinium foliaceum, Strain CCMP 1326" /LENGTH=35 /DNA_ID= /DNA_START= /DNA_END= /DNA_ORIENTATION=
MPIIIMGSPPPPKASIGSLAFGGDFTKTPSFFFTK